jgi:hypothetical protein
MGVAAMKSTTELPSCKRLESRYLVSTRDSCQNAESAPAVAPRLELRMREARRVIRVEAARKFEVQVRVNNKRRVAVFFN